MLGFSTSLTQSSAGYHVRRAHPGLSQVGVINPPAAFCQLPGREGFSPLLIPVHS